jgi:hypothetical protein
MDRIALAINVSGIDDGDESDEGKTRTKRKHSLDAGSLFNRVGFAVLLSVL